MSERITRSARARHADKILTESVNPDSIDIDTLDSRGIVEAIHAEDRRAWQAIDDALDAIAGVIDAVVDAFRDGGRLFYVGAGTSGRLGVLDASECPSTFGAPPEMVVGLIAGGDVALRDSIEGAEDDPQDGARVLRDHAVEGRDVVCGIASSGSTPWVLGALREARERGATTALITCNPRSAAATAANPVDHVVELLVGAEVVAGSTRMKAGTATKMVLNMITTAAMVRLGKVHENRMVDVRPVNRKLVRRALGLIESIGEVDSRRAGELLELSGNDVKIAIVMGRRGVDREIAASLLEDAGGGLRGALS